MRTVGLFACGLVVTAMALGACADLTGPRFPQAPVNVTATLLTGTSVNVSWDASPQSDGVVSYNILRNGTKVGESTTTSYTDAGLPEQQTFKYTVSANCTSGLLTEPSAESPAATVTTADVTPPRVESINPLDGTTGVSLAGTVVAIFTEAMDGTTINPTTFNLKVKSNGLAIPGEVAYTSATRRAEFTPTPGSLPNAASVTVTVTAGAKDLAGNALSPVFASTFTTRDEQPPTVIATSPANNAQGVLVTSPVTVTFSEAMDPASVTSSAIILRVTSSGAAVAGTVAYSVATRVLTFTPNSPLAAPVNYTATVSTALKDLGGNFFGGLQFNFSTGDTAPPSVVSTVPANGATGVPTTTAPSATFSEAMTPSTITSATFTLRLTATGLPVSGTVAYNVATRVATFTPTTALLPGTPYTATITTGAKDLSANALAANFTWTFGTVDNVPPTVTAVSPTNGAANIAVNTAVNLTFSEAMDQTTINFTTITVRNTATSGVVAGAVTYNPATSVATFTPNVALAFGTGYTVTVTTGVKDLAGNAMASQFSPTFTTAAAPDITPPVVTGVSPATGATVASLIPPVNISFSEAMNQTTINVTTITVRNTATSAAVAGTVGYNPATNVATFTPSAPLTNATSYTVTVTTGVRDVASNAMASQFSSTFTTDVTAPTVTAVSPPNNAMNIATSTAVNITFSEAMDQTTLTNTTITLRNSATSALVAGSVSYNAATRVATFTPNVALANGTGYTVTVTTGVKDLAGNAMASPFSSTFTTAAAPDTTPPVVTGVSPATGATVASLIPPVNISFSEAMNQTTINVTTITVRNTATSAAVAGTVGYNPATNVATFTPSAPLTNATSYTVTVTTGVRDVANNAMASQFTSTFTTDITAPIVTGVSPLNGATNVATNTGVGIIFSEAMNQTTINVTTITVRNTLTSAAVAGSVGYNAATHVATFTPTAALANGTGYTVTVTTGVKDVPGNAMASQFSSTFTTAP